MREDLEKPSCNACFSEDASILYDRRRTSAYGLYQCRRCAAQFWWPQTIIVGDWYEKDPSYIIRDQITFNVLGWGPRLFLSHSGQVAGLKLLDIGCGSGVFLSQAQQLGYSVTGLDYDRKAIEQARTAYQLEDVHDCDLLVFCQKIGHEQFDVVTMWSILEHMVHPGEVLRLVTKLIRPGGSLFIEVPNRDTIASDAPPPQHWFRWNKYSLGHLVELCGYEVIEASEKSLTLSDMITMASAHLKLTYLWYWMFRSRLSLSQEGSIIDAPATSAAGVRKLYRVARIMKNTSLGVSLLIPFAMVSMLGKKGPELYVHAVKR